MGDGEDALARGMHVRTADGRDLGRIVAVEGDTISLEKGFLFPTRYELSAADVAEVRDGAARLAVSSEELRLERLDAGRGAAGREEAAEERTTRWDGDRRELSEELRVPVAEEEVLVEKHSREVGAVRVHKRVVIEHRQLTVPVLREEVVVERVAAGPPAAPGEAPAAPFEERTISIPVYEEEIEIVKRPRLREEVRVTKRVRQVQQVAHTDVRRAEVHVEREGDVRAPGSDGSGEPH